MSIDTFTAKAKPLPPPSLPGFERIKRTWDDEHGIYVANIKQGEFYVTNNQHEMIKTTLGSCIAACIRDKQAGVGGMNHFMLPLKGSVYEQKFTHSLLVDAARYGNWAMEYLINEILKHGGVRRRLEVKIFGGGRVLQNMTDIGEKNIQFTLQYIYNEGLTLLNQDVGDIYPRKVLYNPADGIAKVKKLHSADTSEIVQQETDYLKQISSDVIGGETELF